MRADWSVLPARFRYVKTAAERFGVHNGFLDRYQEMIARMKPDEVQLLVSVHEEIRRRGDASRISGWIEHMGTEKPGAARAVFDLFLIFRLLAERKVVPLCFRCIRYSPPQAPRDWSKLPARLRYLRGPAERFGFDEYQSDVTGLVNSATSRQRSRWRALQLRIRRAGDADVIYDWLDKHPPLQHPEAVRVAWLLQVLKAANMPVEDEPKPAEVERFRRAMERQLDEHHEPAPTAERLEQLRRELEQELREARRRTCEGYEPRSEMPRQHRRQKAP